MVKQFTIPCQFQGGSTSPVTLYIGHPEVGHHPVHFQSDWLSSAKGGTIPQDLMDTLQKLHDLANENGADFEELCYYALISATQHGIDSGVSKEDIDKYADEYIKQDGNVNMETNEQSATDTNNDTTETQDNGGSANNVASFDNDNIDNTNAMAELENIPTSDASNTNTADRRVTPTVDVSDQQLLGVQNDVINNNASTNDELVNNTGELELSYSSEDEDLLLMDDDTSS